MRVGDAVDAALRDCPDRPVRLAAVHALTAVFEQCAPDFMGPNAARQMTGESIALCRAALVAALAAFDAARVACPSGPQRLGGAR